MTKAVWKNEKTGKYYTLEGEGENKEFMTVYVDDDVWEKAESHVDKVGKIFKILECKAHETSSGFIVYRVSRPVTNKKVAESIPAQNPDTPF